MKPQVVSVFDSLGNILPGEAEATHRNYIANNQLRAQYKIRSTTKTSEGVPLNIVFQGDILIQEDYNTMKAQNKKLKSLLNQSLDLLCSQCTNTRCLTCKTTKLILKIEKELKNEKNS